LKIVPKIRPWILTSQMYTLLPIKLYAAKEEATQRSESAAMISGNKTDVIMLMPAAAMC
jgi:hypothetical protein